MPGSDNVLDRKMSLLRYVKSIPLEKQAKGKKTLLAIKVGLNRTYKDLKVTLPQPTEQEIIKILEQTKKELKEDQLNCGACGYSSCREKAIAVFQGIAEHEICLPYLLSQKNELVKSINTELARVRRLKDEMDILIDASYDGICMTDGKGNIKRVNKPLGKLLEVDEQLLIGKNVSELEEKKVLCPSTTLMVLNARKPVTFLQKLKSGKCVLATGNPVFDELGNISRVISNIRDFDALQKIKEQLENVYSSPSVEKLDKNYQIIGFSDEFNRVLSMAQRVAIVDSTVLLLGESGSGKEVVARFIHKNSKRSNGPFIKINCGALPESLIESELFGYDTGAFTGAKKAGKQGLFEMAHGGTIFLDEIGELPLTQQVKLLQVIQEKQITRIGSTQHRDVDIRLLAATNRELIAMVKEGNFRADLFYRLNVVPILIPPLRERHNDIIPLMYFFLERFNQRYNKECRVPKEVKEVFLEYSWPGNVRELENIMERLVVISSKSVISREDLPPIFDKHEKSADKFSVQGILPLKKAQEEMEKHLLLRARELYGSTYKIAEVLGVNQSTVVRKLKKYTDNAKRNY
jgi:transcriptional regulator with PAS, ATPase and Fis domain